MYTKHAPGARRKTSHAIEKSPRVSKVKSLCTREFAVLSKLYRIRLIDVQVTARSHCTHMTCTATGAAGMLNSTPVMTCTLSLRGFITIINTLSLSGITPNVHGRALHTISCRCSRVACDTAWHATQRGMRHRMGMSTSACCCRHRCSPIACTRCCYYRQRW